VGADSRLQSWRDISFWFQADTGWLRGTTQIHNAQDELLNHPIRLDPSRLGAVKLDSNSARDEEVDRHA
jgi:hypothetical protein